MLAGISVSTERHISTRCVRNDFSEWTHLSVPYMICETPYCATQIYTEQINQFPTAGGDGETPSAQKIFDKIMPIK